MPFLKDQRIPQLPKAIKLTQLKYDHIIWDFNGTLLDDVWLCVEVLNHILTTYGKAITSKDKYLDQFVHPVIDYYTALGFDFDKDSFDDIAVLYHAEYDRRCTECSLYPKTEQTLIALSGMGFTHSVRSAYQQHRLENALKHFKIDHHFRIIAGLDNYYAHSKIERGIELVKELNANPKRTVLIGDTVHDYEAATAMGTNCILIANGHNPAEKLKQCDAIVTDSISNVIFLLT